MKREAYFESIENTHSLSQYPIECFYMDKCIQGLCSPHHWHLYSEIIYVNKGELTVVMNENKYELYKGDLIYINPKQIHSTLCWNAKDTKLTVIKFSQDILKSSFENKREIT